MQGRKMSETLQQFKDRMILEVFIECCKGIYKENLDDEEFQYYKEIIVATITYLESRQKKEEDF